MSLWQSWDDYLVKFGEETADFTQQISQQIVTKQCQLYAKYPNALGVFPIYRGILNNICTQSDPSFQLPESPGFSGGQCPGVFYNVFGIYRNANETFGPCGVALEWTVSNTPGPIVEVIDQPGAFRLISGGGGVSSNLQALPSGNVVGIRNTCAPIGSLPSPAGFPESAQITRVETVDNSPDNCGNPPPVLPPDPPQDASDFNTTIVINNRDSSDNSIIDIIGINAPITINADIDFKLSFNLGGVSFNLGSDGIGNDSEGSDTGGGGGGGGGSSEIVPPPNSEDYDEEEKDVEGSGEETVGIEIAYITLELTLIPANAKTQFGVNGPDVYYAGWFEFRTEGFFYVRQPIHWQKNIFVPPKGATGYAYTLYTGFNGIIRTYKLKE